MKTNSTLRNTMYSSVAMYTEFALGLVTSILIARHLGPEAYGSYSAAIWLVGLGIALTNSGTASAAIRFIAELRGSGATRQHGALLRSLRHLQHIYLVVVLAGIALVIAATRARIAPAFDQHWLYAFLVVAIALRSSYMFNVGVIKGHEDFRSIASIALTASPLNLLFVALVMVLDLPDYTLLWAFLASTVVFAAMARWRTRRFGDALESPLDPAMTARVRRQVAYGTAIVTFGFLTASELEVSLLNMFDLHAAAGQFKVAHQLATGAATLVPGVFAALMLPMMSRAVQEGAGVAGQRLSRSTSYLMLLAAPVAAFGMAMGPQMVGLLYGAPYAEAARWFPWMLAATCLLALTAASSSLLISTDRQNMVLLVLIACSLLKIALGGLLIHQFALPGAVLAFAVASLANAASTTFLASQASRAQLQWRRLARIAAASAIAGIAVLPIAHNSAPLPGVLAGAVVFAVAYAASTLWLGCWEDEDLDVMRGLSRRLPAGAIAWRVVSALAPSRRTRVGRRA